MLVTDKLVVLNLPKTGSTFTRKVLKKIYDQRFLRNRIINALIRFKLKPVARILRKSGLGKKGYTEILTPHPTILNYKEQHGGYFQIPDQFKGRKIVSVVRNPYDRFLSIYNYRFWVKYPPLPLVEVKSKFESFPELDLDDYVDFSKMVADDLKKKYRIASNVIIGEQSIQFIRMFFKDPQTVFNKIDNDYILAGDFEQDLADIEFMRQESLNDDLAKILTALNYPKKEVQTVKNHGRINKTKHDNVKGLTEKATKYITDYEKLIFRILESKGITYTHVKS